MMSYSPCVVDHVTPSETSCDPNKMGDEEPLLPKSQQSRRNTPSSINRFSTQLSASEVDHVDILGSHEPKKDFTWHLALSIAACTLGSSFQFGYNTGIVNVPAQTIQDFYKESYFNQTGSQMPPDTMTVLWAITVSIYCIGGATGGVSAGILADRWGRRRLLLLNNIVLVVSIVIEVLSKFVNVYELLIVGRLFIGINAGINTGTAPMYLSEIAPISLRGLCGTLNQLCITLGVLVSSLLGIALDSPTHWPFAFGVPLIFMVWQLCSLSFCPESPRWLLISRNSEDEAEKALQWLRCSQDVSDEIEEMISERDMARHVKKFTAMDLIHSPDLRKPLIISLVMHLSQQFSGINAVIQYSTSIFKSAGLSTSAAQYATVATGAVNVCMTFVSALIMDRLGRRTLHLIGLGGMFITSYILTVSLIFEEYYSFLKYICVLAAIFYIVSFATGPGSIPWFYVAELFAQGPRSAAVSVGVLVNWSANFIVVIAYPFLKSSIHDYSFIPFVVMLAIFWLFTLFKVPETKGMSIEDITSTFKESKRDSLNDTSYAT